MWTFWGTIFVSTRVQKFWWHTHLNQDDYNHGRLLRELSSSVIFKSVIQIILLIILVIHKGTEETEGQGAYMIKVMVKGSQEKTHEV